ncbi:MAG: hypothetical protein OXH73_06555 [Caldilineaceae bacterium]|nr:hypothetical protein [Caldilineaceae bacterium]
MGEAGINGEYREINSYWPAIRAEQTLYDFAVATCEKAAAASFTEAFLFS